SQTARGRPRSSKTTSSSATATGTGRAAGPVDEGAMDSDAGIARMSLLPAAKSLTSWLSVPISYSGSPAHRRAEAQRHEGHEVLVRREFRRGGCSARTA